MTIFKDNIAASQYELDIDGQIVFARYKKVNDMQSITHVETPEALRGQGAAAKLMEQIAKHARASGIKLVPICGYAVLWMKRNKEYADIMANSSS